MSKRKKPAIKDSYIRNSFKVKVLTYLGAVGYTSSLFAWLPSVGVAALLIMLSFLQSLVKEAAYPDLKTAELSLPGAASGSEPGLSTLAVIITIFTGLILLGSLALLPLYVGKQAEKLKQRFNKLMNWQPSTAKTIIFKALVLAVPLITSLILLSTPGEDVSAVKQLQVITGIFIVLAMKIFIVQHIAALAVVRKDSKTI